MRSSKGWVKYNARKKLEQRERVALDRTVPIKEWNKDTFLSIALDRGFKSEQALYFAISRGLNVTIATAENLINTGRMSWGQVVVLGALFEMTPKEFCDTFLHGYFREREDGRFLATVDDPFPLLQTPVRNIKQKEKKEQEDDT